jgi:hypothetical protein
LGQKPSKPATIVHAAGFDAVDTTTLASFPLSNRHDLAHIALYEIRIAPFQAICHGTSSKLCRSGANRVQEDRPSSAIIFPKNRSVRLEDVVGQRAEINNA